MRVETVSFLDHCVFFVSLVAQTWLKWHMLQQVSTVKLRFLSLRGLSAVLSRARLGGVLAVSCFCITLFGIALGLLVFAGFGKMVHTFRLF